MKKMEWILIVSLMVIVITAVLMSYSGPVFVEDKPVDKPVKPQKYDFKKLYDTEIDTAVSETRARALEQYKMCPPLRPERFRRRIKMLWGVDIRDYPENALVSFGDVTFYVSLKYQILYGWKLWITDGPPQTPPGTDRFYSLCRQFIFMNDTTLYDAIKDYTKEMADSIIKTDRRFNELRDEVHEAYDVFLALYRTTFGIQPRVIECLDKNFFYANTGNYFPPSTIKDDSYRLPYRVSDIRRDLFLLYIAEQIGKGRELVSYEDRTGTGLNLGFAFNRFNKLCIDEIGTPQDGEFMTYPWRNYSKERNLAAFLSFLVHLQQKMVNKTIIMYMSGQMDEQIGRSRPDANHEAVRDSIRSNNYYGYAVLREFCENPEREMPTLEKVGSSFKATVKAKNALLYLEPFADSYDIDTLRSDESFIAYEMGHDDYYFVETVKPVESPIAGPDGYALILDRTETVYGYVRKTEVKEFTDSDLISQTTNIGKGKPGVVIDPDGYVNIRKAMNAQSEIIGKIVKKESFDYWEIPGSNWCVVKTQTGILGFVYKDRIKEKINAGGWILEE